MPLKTLVKAGSITNLSDARYCSGMGVSLLGFRTIEGQENFISRKVFQDIRGWVVGPQVVAEVYGIRSSEALDTVLEDYRPDMLEMGMAELSAITSSSLPIILSVSAAEALTINTSGYEIAYLLIHDFDFTQTLPTGIPLLIDLPDPEMLSTILQKIPGAGIAVNGSVEIKPGLKDYELLANVLEQLDEDN